jgi:hypothetical protein
MFFPIVHNYTFQKWGGGMTLTFGIRPYAKSNKGWSIAIETSEPLSATAKPEYNHMMELTSVSNHNQIFSFG